MPLAAIGGIVSGVGGLVSGAMGSSAASKAADAQADAAKQAAQLQYDAGQKALGLEQDQWNTTQQTLNPYLQSGAGGLNALQYGLGTGGSANDTGVGQGSLLTPYQSFNAPTGLTEQNDPGYQARLKLGTDAIQRSAAARGGVVTGGTAKALDAYGQDYGSNEYGNVYNRALNDYTTNANNYYMGQNNQYNRLSALAGMGQQTASTLGQLGASNANSEANTITGAANNQAQSLQNAAAATASGYVGGANAWSNGINGASNNLTNLALISQLGRSGNSNAAGGLSAAQQLASKTGYIPTLNSPLTSMIGY